MVESQGLWSPHVIWILETLARRAFEKISISQSVCNLHRQLSSKLWLCNARMVVERLSLDCSDSPCKKYTVLCMIYIYNLLYILIN